jgi:hypothetical protein
MSRVLWLKQARRREAGRQIEEQENRIKGREEVNNSSGE